MPTDVVRTLISFDAMLFIKFLVLSPNWHTSTIQALDDYCNKLENEFVHTYHQFLYFKQSFSASMPIEFCRQKGVRVDRVIEAEILKSSQTLGKTIKVAYSYKLAGQKHWLRSDFKLDVIGEKKKRLKWIHQDQINKETYVQPIQPVCVGDSIELAVSLFSLHGFVTDIKWEPAVI